MYLKCNKSHQACSTVGCLALTHPHTGTRVQAIDTSTIYYTHIPATAVEELLAIPLVLQCAGALFVNLEHYSLTVLL